MLRKLFHILAAASVMVGCNTALLENAGEVGYLSVDFSCGDSTKAAEIDLSGYSVSIKGKTLDFSLESTCGELPAVVELVPGDYEISVSSPNAAPAVFDTPIYSSFTEFSITKGITVSLTMLLGNVSVIVKKSDQFNASTVRQCSVVVGNEYGELTWNLDDITSERKGYFRPSDFLTIHAEGTTSSGVRFEFDDTLLGVETGDLHIITMGTI